MRLLILVALLGFFNVAHSAENLVDLTATLNLTTFIDLLDTAGLTESLASAGPHTLLAPTNAAWMAYGTSIAALKANPTALKNIMEYHIIKGDIFSWDLRSGTSLKTMNGHTVYVTVFSREHKVHFNQAVTQQHDIQASNGVIYIIDAVLQVPLGTIDQIIANPMNHVLQFYNLVVQARLEASLNFTGATRYTVFAPNDDAFKKLPASNLATIFSTPAYANELVRYHIHPGTLHSKSLTHDGYLSTELRSHYLHVQITNGQATINSAKLLKVDFEADNGLVHIIDSVVIPTSLANILG